MDCQSSAEATGKRASTPDASDNGLAELIYICDHLAHFPYKTVDEIYHLAHSLDLRISTIGSGLVRSLQDCLVSSAQLKAESTAAADSTAAEQPPPLIYDRKVRASPFNSCFNFIWPINVIAFNLKLI